jgi:4-amino-4-deoxy-L-arabinose transferase-like glycosyltransferase
VGYVLPNAQGLAPTVWPPGYSVLLALVYRLGGESAMLSLNLWLGLLSLFLTVALTVLVCPPRWRRLSLHIGMGAAFVVATSFEQFTAQAIPMADAAAQLFTTLALVMTLYALRASPTHLHTHALLAGLALAAATSVRYTQVLAAPGIALIAWFGLKDARHRCSFLAAFAFAALAGAAPDAWYRTRLRRAVALRIVRACALLVQRAARSPPPPERRTVFFT